MPCGSGRVSRGPEARRSRLPWMRGSSGAAVGDPSPGLTATVVAACDAVGMGIERSAQRKRRDNRRAAEARSAQTRGGPVVVRRVGDPVPENPPEMPARRVAAQVANQDARTA